MSPTNPNRQCSVCGTQESSRWNGKRHGRTLYWKCYQREWQEKQRASKRPKVFTWAGE